MNPDVAESRAPNLSGTLQDMDQPKRNPVYTSWQESNNSGPNHHRKHPLDSSPIIVFSVAVPLVPNAYGPGHTPPPKHQEAQFLHHFILELPTLVRMYHNMLKESISHCQCRLVGQLATGKPRSIEKNSPPLPGHTDCLSEWQQTCLIDPWPPDPIGGLHQHIQWDPVVGTETSAGQTNST